MYTQRFWVMKHIRHTFADFIIRTESCSWFHYIHSSETSTFMERHVFRSYSSKTSIHTAAKNPPEPKLNHSTSCSNIHQQTPPPITLNHQSPSKSPSSYSSGHILNKRSLKGSSGVSVLRTNLINADWVVWVVVALWEKWALLGLMLLVQILSHFIYFLSNANE